MTQSLMNTMFFCMSILCHWVTERLDWCLNGAQISRRAIKGYKKQ